MGYELTKLRQVHHEVMRLDLQGWSRQDIAEYLGIDPLTVLNVQNSEVYIRQIDSMRAAIMANTIDVQSQIQAQVPEALAILRKLMRSEDVSPQVRAKIAMDNLDRAGYAPPKVVRTENLHALISKEDIEEIKKRAMANGIIKQVCATQPIEVQVQES